MKWGNRMSNFKIAREQKGISQKEIALTLGVSQPTVSEWESGKKTPSGKNLMQLSELLDCSTDYLLGVTNYPIGDIKYSLDEIEQFLNVDPTTLNEQQRNAIKQAENMSKTLSSFFDKNLPSVYEKVETDKQRLIKIFGKLTPHQFNRFVNCLDSFTRNDLLELCKYAEYLKLKKNNHESNEDKKIDGE